MRISADICTMYRADTAHQRVEGAGQDTFLPEGRIRAPRADGALAEGCCLQLSSERKASPHRPAFATDISALERIAQMPVVYVTTTLEASASTQTAR